MLLQSQGLYFKDLTTTKVGGKVHICHFCSCEDSLLKTLESIDFKRSFLVLGQGSNIIIDNFTGPVLVIKTNDVKNHICEYKKNNNIVSFTVFAGVLLDNLVKHCIDNDIYELVNFSGIPGTIAGAIVGNAGAYGSQIADFIDSITVFDTHTKTIKTMNNSELGFDYRNSKLKKFPLRFVIINAKFKMTLKNEHEYTRNDILAIRKSKGMLLDESDVFTNSSGSFFKNPIVSKNIADTLENDAPKYNMPNGEVKLSAAWLIENSGIHKGFSLNTNGASISNKHCLAICNIKDATFDDIINLASYIIKEVNNKFSIMLQLEPIIISEKCISIE